MDKISRACLNCKFYDRFYTKGMGRLDKQAYGMCINRFEVQRKNFVCENWQYNPESSRLKKKLLQREFAKEVLNKFINELTVIGQILADDGQDEN